MKERIPVLLVLGRDAAFVSAGKRHYDAKFAELFKGTTVVVHSDGNPAVGPGACVYVPRQGLAYFLVNHADKLDLSKIFIDQYSNIDGDGDLWEFAYKKLGGPWTE